MNIRCIGKRMAAVLLAGLLGACDGDSAGDDPAYIPEPGDLRRITLLETAGMAQTRDQLARQVGNRFELLYDAAHVAQARLVALVPGADDPAVDQFSLVFEAPAGLELAAGIYTWRHYELGTMDLYVEPQPNPGGNPRYRAEVSILRVPEDG